ncbi:citrate synthase [Kibdelosporangium banguiense]|uniref:Citrate synthase n=1 Tax=Kibdelosporangium banguiense TaxID=1365924 RepID=A0ABS4TK56_9PSEU|nr:citrate synthase [Kibdelosporangium banguiense]
MTTGNEPAPVAVAALEPYLVSTVDHGFNASTFTVVASSGADVVSAIAAAIGTFSGPLHGGAPDRALATIDEIGTPDRIDEWIRAKVLAGDKIMGFGHAVYRTEDPRARMLREIGAGLGGDLIDFATAVERRVVEILAELKPGRVLHTSVEFYAGVVIELCGVPRSMFHADVRGQPSRRLVRQRAGTGTGRQIIRPAARYVGPPPG